VTSASRHLRPGRLVARLLAVTALLLAMGVPCLAAADTTTAAACAS
jgi:ABC-type Fe2+-enterobactin transport system substrate-binding protein